MKDCVWDRVLAQARGRIRQRVRGQFAGWVRGQVWVDIQIREPVWNRASEQVNE